MVASFRLVVLLTVILSEDTVLFLSPWPFVMVLFGNVKEVVPADAPVMVIMYL